MTEDSRPLSPHIGIYSWQITMVLSILHRASGLFLAAGAIYLVYWLSALSAGPESFAAVQAQLGGVIGRLSVLLWSAALFYHMCNGIRHLFWDAGLGFEIETVRRSGWAVVVATVVLTGLSWWLATRAGI